MAQFTLTIREGPKVNRERHESLEESLASLREHAERIRAEGGLEQVSLIRTYEPSVRVKARLEISTGGMLRGRDAGLDVMGDGALNPFRGGVVRRPLPPGDGDGPYDAIAAALRA
jgi:hypothetical protein